MSSLSRRSFLQQSSASVLAAAAIHAVNARVRNVASAAGKGDSLEVGVAVRDITPEPGIVMWGYTDRLDGAKGTRDPLYAKSAVLKVGDTALGIVALDLGRMPVPERCAQIREKAAAFGLDDVIICATHTHGGPYMEIDGLPHLQPTDDAIVDCLKEAALNVEPAKMGLARTTIDISHNRRLIKDGVCYMMWRNEERKPTSPVDHEAGLLHFTRASDDSAIVTMVNYACHPVVFGSDNEYYSADWPGEMCSVVKDATGGECMFLQGGAGDINPYLDKTKIDQGAVEDMKQEGRKAGEAVVAGLKGIVTATPESPSIAYREEPVEVGLRWDLEDPTQIAILESAYGPLYEKYMKGKKPDFSIPLGVLVLNNDLALSFMPGELFVDFQLDLKRRSALRDTFLVGYANEFHVYFPTMRDISYGGYGAATVSYVGVGAGEKLVTESTRLIGEMTGGIHPLRGAEDFEILEL